MRPPRATPGQIPPNVTTTEYAARDANPFREPLRALLASRSEFPRAHPPETYFTTCVSVTVISPSWTISSTMRRARAARSP